MIFIKNQLLRDSSRRRMVMKDEVLPAPGDTSSGLRDCAQDLSDYPWSSRCCFRMSRSRGYTPGLLVGGTAGPRDRWP